MLSNNSGLKATSLKVKGKNIQTIKAKVIGTEYSIEDVHDSQWQYELSYSINGVKYSGSTYQYIHWAPNFVMEYFNKLYKDGGEILIRIDGDNPESYDANMDYAIAMALGPEFIEGNESYEIQIKKVDEVDNCVEVIIKGDFYNEAYFTKTIFKLLSSGYKSFIFNITEVEKHGFSISGSFGWATRYASAFTSDKKFALLLKKGQNIQGEGCRIISDSREEIIEKFISNYMTDEEKRVAEYEEMTEEEKEEYLKKVHTDQIKQFKSARAYANSVMYLFRCSLKDKIINFAKSIYNELKLALTLTKEEKEMKRQLARAMKSAKIGIKKETLVDLKKSLINEWKEVMKGNH